MQAFFSFFFCSSFPPTQYRTQEERKTPTLADHLLQCKTQTNTYNVRHKWFTNEHIDSWSKPKTPWVPTKKMGRKRERERSLSWVLPQYSLVQFQKPEIGNLVLGGLCNNNEEFPNLLGNSVLSFREEVVLLTSFKF
jgi:hypothetical protein